VTSREEQAADVLSLLKADERAMLTLRAVASLGLPDWMIGAGFVRNIVWDRLSGHTKHTPPNDIDVLYHDARDITPRREETIEARLRELKPELPWSVRNQARMHLKNGDPPYGSTECAIRSWLETPTCVAVRLEPDDHLTLIAPFGLDDLFSLTVRPTPRGRERLADYHRRMTDKNWAALWPRLTFVP
jgi:hypothetical protein